MMRACRGATKMAMLALIWLWACGPARVWAGPSKTSSGSKPTIELVQRAALRAAGLRSGKTRAWILRARLAPLLPTRFQVRFGDDFSDDVRITESGDGYTNKLGSDRQRKLQFMAEWDLSRLVFQPDELRISDRHLARVQRRVTLLVRVTRLYFDRERLLLRLVVPAKSEEEVALLRIKLREVTALLDTLTGGCFRGRWRGVRLGR